MAQDFKRKTFGTRAIELKDEIGLIAGSGFPWDDYINVPVGSRYFKQDGKVYRKIGTGDNVANWCKDFDPDEGDDSPDDTYENPFFWAFGGIKPNGVN